MVVEAYGTGLAMVEHQSPKTLRVALIDPDPVQRVVTQHILTRRGHHVVPLESGIGFSERLSAQPIDVVVISDEAVQAVDLPGATRANGGLPVVAITNQEIGIEEARAFSVVLPRPVGSRELLAAVAMATRRSPGTIIHR